MSTLVSNLYPPIVDDTLSSIIYNSDIYRFYFNFPFYTSLHDIDYIQISLVNQKTNISILKGDTGIVIIGKNEIQKSENDDFSYYIDLDREKYINGQLLLNTFYKMQLRFGTFINGNEEISQNNFLWLEKHKNYCSEWSKVCLIKGIGTIKVNINEFLSLQEKAQGNLTFTDSLSQITGKIIFEQGQIEYLKNYNIKILDNNESLIFQSGQIYTDSYNPNEFYYELNTVLDEGEQYIFIFTYTTSNGYSDSVNYNFIIVASGGETLKSTYIIAQPNEEYGRMQITIDSDSGTRFVGNITIRRTSSESNFSKWEDVHTFYYPYNNPLNYVWYDYTIKSGVWYKYAGQKRDSLGNRGVIFDSWKSYNATTNPKNLINKPVMCVLDDIFLTKENCQLKIKFNPSLNEFKYNITESQAVTIGSKYPYIRRNGANYFRTFPIGGLISSLIDMSSWYNPHLESKYENVTIPLENNAKLDIAKIGQMQLGYEQNIPKIIQGQHIQHKFHPEKNELKLFTSKEEIYNKNFIYNANNEKYSILNYYKNYNKQNNINEYNDYIYEREFREKVYDFLYKNDVKLFRSTTEGNILIKLMNIDFQPVETLGRMLYSFTATAVQIDQANLINYNKYGIQLLGECEKEVTSFTHKVGELTQNFAPEEDIIEKIRQYQNTIAPKNFITTSPKLTYLKLEIDSDPYVIIDDNGQLRKATLNDDTNNAIMGYLVNINNSTIVIPPLMERKTDYLENPNNLEKLNNPSETYIIHLGFFELKGDHVQINQLSFPENTQVTVSYEADVAYVEDTTTLIKDIYYDKNVGQICDIFEPNKSIVQKIYNKYAFNYSDYYKRLLWIDELAIQGPNNTVIYLKGPNNTKANRIVLVNGFYQLKDDDENVSAIMRQEESSDLEFPDLWFFGKHFTKRTSFTKTDFEEISRINGGYLNEIPQFDPPQLEDNATIEQQEQYLQQYEQYKESYKELYENKIYHILSSTTPAFDPSNFEFNNMYGGILLVITPNQIEDNQNSENKYLLIEEDLAYKKYVFYKNVWYQVEQISNITNEPKAFKEYLRLDDTEYIEIMDSYNNREQIENPILNGMYIIDNKKWIYYQNEWYQLNEKYDIECPIEGIVDYTYETMKGVYNKNET